MNVYIIAMDAAAALLVLAVVVGLAIAARRAPRGPFRASSLGGAAVCLLLVIASLRHLLLVAAHMGLLAPHWVDSLLLGPLAAIQATLAVFVAVFAVVLARHYWHRVGRAHTMVDVLTERLPSDAHARQARLTAREQEVLDLIRKGVIADAEIARALHIAPATAATHVQRILHKTRLRNRRELMLLPAPKSAA